MSARSGLATDTRAAGRSSVMTRDWNSGTAMPAAASGEGMRSVPAAPSGITTGAGAGAAPSASVAGSIAPAVMHRIVADILEWQVCMGASGDQ